MYWPAEYWISAKNTQPQISLLLLQLNVDVIWLENINQYENTY